MNKKSLRILLIVGLLVVVIVVLAKSGALGKDEGTRVSTEKVVRRSITEIVTASGKVYPEKEVKISPDVSGEVVELGVTQEGDSVHKGQMLARVYADILTNQRDQAAAQVNQQQALVSNIQEQLPGLKTSMETAKRALDREKQLRQDSVVSESEYETAENTFRTAEANYMAALQMVRGNQAGPHHGRFTHRWCRFAAEHQKRREGRRQFDDGGHRDDARRRYEQDRDDRRRRRERYSQDTVGRFRYHYRRCLQ